MSNTGEIFGIMRNIRQFTKDDVYVNIHFTVNSITEYPFYGGQGPFDGYVF